MCERWIAALPQISSLPDVAIEATTDATSMPLERYFARECVKGKSIMKLVSGVVYVCVFVFLFVSFASFHVFFVFDVCRVAGTSVMQCDAICSAVLAIYSKLSIFCVVFSFRRFFASL
jgi:hypothetical protein